MTPLSAHTASRLLRRLLRAPGRSLAGSVLLTAIGGVLLRGRVVAAPGGRFGPAASRAWVAGALGAVAALPLVSRTGLVPLARLLLHLRVSLPPPVHDWRIESLEWPVTIDFDDRGIPTITAQTRLDAMRALGYVTARDRLFQMDLLRREAAGRLSELLGEQVLGTDMAKRVLGFHRVAERIVAALPIDQREALIAYAEGVNASIAAMDRPPFECMALGYRPEPWTAAASILVVLAMFERLCFDYDQERMMTILEQSLPPEVVAFLTPDTDDYTTVLLGGNASWRPVQPIPVPALAALRRPRHGHARPAAQGIISEHGVIGSNAWAVSGARTADGRAILANDIHLRLSIPNIFYRAALRYGDAALSGVTLPGIPVVLAGSNGDVAWGVTNLGADCMDLVTLEINPDDPDEYRTPAGWERFERVSEVIHIRGRQAHHMEVRLTHWGPVTESNLLGRQVALHATALDPSGVDIGLMDMDRARTVDDGVTVANAFAGPPLSVMLTDRDGRIAWTICGKVPRRRGFDGTTARSWANGAIGWDGYIPASELPRVVDPPQGFLVVANNRPVGKEYPYALGYNFSNGYRAYRLSQRLRELTAADEAAMFALQSDTTAEYYEFYRALALDILSDEVVGKRPQLADLRASVAAWDGRAEPESRGLPVLVCFREVLADAVFSPFLEVCREADNLFRYAWFNLEVPLRALLTERPPALLPDPDTYPDWNAFLVGSLEHSGELLRARHRVRSFRDLRWGAANRASVTHPLAATTPGAGWLLNMPRTPLPGCGHCVCVATPRFGATMRMVVSAGRDRDGFLHMPGGQSGHPLSPRYDDQHGSWVRRQALPFLPGAVSSQATVVPGSHG